MPHPTLVGVRYRFRQSKHHKKNIDGIYKYYTINSQLNASGMIGKVVKLKILSHPDDVNPFYKGFKFKKVLCRPLKLSKNTYKKRLIPTIINTSGDY